MLFVYTYSLVYVASGDAKMHARGRWSGRRDAELIMRCSGRRGRRDAETLRKKERRVGGRRGDAAMARVEHHTKKWR
jgi:hypothetical protein